LSDEATETGRRILTLRETHRSRITEHLGRAAGNGHKVLEALYDRPILSLQDVQSLTGTGYAAANNLVARLTELWILLELTGFVRNRRFRYDLYVHLFTDEPTDTTE